MKMRAAILEQLNAPPVVDQVNTSKEDPVMKIAAECEGGRGLQL